MTGRPRVAPQLLSTVQAGRRLGVSDDTVRALIAAGDLPGVNVATKSGDVRWRVAEPALAAYVEARTHTAPRRVRRSA